MSGREAHPTLHESTDGYTEAASPPTVLDGTNAIAVSFYSVPVRVVDFDYFRFAFTCPATGAPNGTLIVQATIDEVLGLAQVPSAADLPAQNWSQLAFNVNGVATNSFAIANATQVIVDELRCNYAWIRLQYTMSSGSITPTARLRLRGDKGR